MSSLRCPNAASSSAKLFVQLSLRHQLTSRPAPILDILLPAARAHHTSAIRPRQNHDQRPRFQTRRRTFTTSLPRRRTQAIYNPQVDEDGKEMMLEITPRAAKRLKEIMQKDANPALALRIQVESGGCHGFQYLMSLVTLPPNLPSPTTTSSSETEQGEDGSAIGEDDTIFTFSPGDDDLVEGSGGFLEKPKIILDGPSLDLLKGSKVDYTMELIGSQFKIVDNPLATSSCGCGTSFDIKM